MIDKIKENTIWTIIDSHWKCIYRKYVQNGCELIMKEYCVDLATYLWMHEFDIPDTITYCLAKNSRYAMKFRHCGNKIEIFISYL